MATLSTVLSYGEPTGTIIAELGAPGPQGQPGPQGPAGQTGSAATIVVGTVTTVPAGNPATVTNVGNPSAAVFNFGLPQGVKGDKGDTGSQGPAGPSVWGGITGSISSQTDLASALAGKYPTTNPAGYITVSSLSGYATESWVSSQGFLTSSALTGYATQSWVNSQGFLTSSALTGYATQSWVTSQGFITASALTPYLLASTAAATYAPLAHQVPAGGTTGQILAKASSSDWSLAWTTIIPGDRYLTTSTTSNAVSNGAKTFTVGTGLSYSPTQDLTIAYDAGNHMHGTVTSYDAGTGVLVVDIQTHTGAGTYASWTVNVGGISPVASVAWGDITGTLGLQSDLATALNDKLDSTTAASTYYLQTNPDGYITSAALAGYATESWVGSQGYLTDAPSDGTIYGRQNGSWVASGGSAVWGSITGTLSAQTDLDNALYAKFDKAGGTITGSIHYEDGDYYTNLNAGEVIARNSNTGYYGQISDAGCIGGDTTSGNYTQISPAGVRFPDGSVQTFAISNNAQLNTNVFTATSNYTVTLGNRNGIVLCQSGCGYVYLSDSSEGWTVGQQILFVNNSGGTIQVIPNGSSTIISYASLTNIGINGVCAAVYVDTNLWVISGNLS